MAEVYVTLGEAAELERVKYNTMVKRVLRKQESFVTKTEKSENGGKDVVLVAVSSLSKQARNAWKEREKLKSFTEEFPDKKEDEQKPEVPWYVNTDVDWYIENYKERYYKAVELGNVVRKFLQYDEGDRTKYAEEFAQKYLGKGQRTLYRYTKAYLEASAWADKLEKEDGAGREFFKVLCLCRKPKETGCFPSIKPEVKQVIKNIWFNEDFARNQGTREMLYEKLTAIANINKWEKIPSYQTVTRYISYLMEDEGMRNAWFLASRGTREYKNKVMVKGSRDTKGLQVMQIVMGDEHTFDCWVSYKQPNGKVIAIKPHLAAWVDMRSRVIMGDVMCKDANSDILKQSLLKMIYSEPGGVPEYLYIDNGKDYTAKTMTGRDRNDRSGMNFDNETMGFYKSIGIKDDHRALPYEPWSKGQIERFFRTVCNKFTRWMKAILGQTLTSDSGGGSYAQSKTHNEVRHDLTVADAKSLAVTIRRDIIRPLVEFNYGSEANIPFFGFDCHEVEDQKEVVEIYKTLACDMGLEIPKSHIYKKFNIPKPENGEEVLKPPQAGMMTAQQQPMETTEELKLKQEEGQAEQRQVDTIVSIANKQSEDIL